MKKKSDYLFSPQYDKYLIVAILFLEAIFLGIAASTLGSTIDEIEHLHNSWLVSTGMIPYRDFFEHHNPLLWYIFAPISKIFYNSANVFYAGHIFSLIFSTATLYYIYKIITEHIASPVTALIALLFYMGINTFGRQALIEFRPDIPMYFCFWCGLYYYMNYTKNKRTVDLKISFILFFFSFLFLQKIILLLFFLGLYTLYQLYNKTFKWRDIFVALIIPTICLIIFILYLYLTNALPNYWTLNYSLNAMIPQYYGYHKIIWKEYNDLIIPMTNGYASVNYPLYTTIVIIPILFYTIFLWKKNNRYYNLIIFMFLSELSIRHFTFGPYNHYYTLLDILATIILSTIITSYLASKTLALKILCLTIFICYVINGVIKSHNAITNNYVSDYIKTLEFVIQNSNENDTILNGNNLVYNIYRKNPDYLGFLYNDIGYIYNQTYGNKNYDINQIIIEKKPKIIWMEDYINTPLQERRYVYIRNFNNNMLDILRKYPDKNINAKEILPHIPTIYAYKLNKELLSLYYRPTGFKKFWILKEPESK